MSLLRSSFRLSAFALFLGFAPVSVVHAEPSRNINTYVLFAYEDCDFKGRNADPTRGFITGGNVGVNKIDTHNPPNPVLSLGANGEVYLSSGTQVVANTARINSNANLYDLYVNVLIGDSPPTVRNQGPTGFAAPILGPGDLPPPPVCTPGTIPVVVESNTTVNLTAGSYGDIQVKDDGTLNLGAGNYQVKSVSCGRRVTINTVPGTILTVSEDFHLNNGSYVGPACDFRLELCSNNVDSNNSTVSFGRNSTFYGTVFAPFGRINLGHSSDLFGRFWAETIGSDWNVNIEFCPTIPTAVKQDATWGAIKAMHR